MAALGEIPFPDSGRYAHVRLLGKGGMGAVYEVEDRVRGGRVALKVMLRGDAERLLRFKREFRLAADLHHPNLVRLFDLSVDESCWFFTMELVDGQPLTDLLHDTDEAPATCLTDTVPVAASGATITDVRAIERPPSPPLSAPPEPACELAAFRTVALQLVDALGHLHRRGIVHRDLKPSNVLVDMEGRARLLDFGLASRLDRSQNITAEGMVAGTLGYMAPEILLGGTATPESDLYSLGCMMFELLTGRRPFEGTGAQIFHAHTQSTPPRVDDRVRGVPKALSDVCFRLLARDPARRPALAEVRAALAPGRPAPPRSTGAAGAGALFVGRARELEALVACLDRAEAGEGRLAIVSGPSGIGKSALAGRLAGEAERRGQQVFRGRSYEREQLPFRTLDRAVDSMILALSAWPAARRRKLGSVLQVLQRPFPAMELLTRTLAPADGEPRSDPGSPDERRMHQSFAELLARLGEERPVVLWLDDLQWADDESLDLLLALFASKPGRLTVIGTCRDEALGDDRPLRKLLSLAGASATRVALTPLAPEQARDLVDGVARKLDAGARSAIVEQAGGNPFLLVELGHRLERDAAEMRSAPEGGILDLLLSGLSPGATELLEIASAAGGDISEGLLAEAAGLSSVELDRTLGDLFARRLLVRLADEPLAPRAEGARSAEAWQLRRLDLSHDRIREAVYQRLPPERRRALHEEIARILETSSADRGRDVDALLRHWTLAGNPDRRRRFALQASVRAEEQLASRHAARMLRIVLDDPDPAEPPEVTTSRWEHLGDLYTRCNLLSGAAEAYERALSDWESAPGGEERDIALLRLSGRLGETYVLSGRPAEGAAVLARGAARSGLELSRSGAAWTVMVIWLSLRVALTELLPPSRKTGSALASAELQVVASAVHALATIWPRMAIEAALRTELIAWRVRSIPELVRSRAARAMVPVLLRPMTPRRMRRAWSLLKQADALAREANDADGVLFVRVHEGILWATTDMQRGRAALESAVAGFEKRGMGDSYDGTLARGYLFLMLSLKGDFREVLSLTERELLRSGEHKVNRLLALGVRGQVLAAVGRAEESAELLAEMDRLLEPLPLCSLHGVRMQVRTLHLTTTGQFAQALEETLAFERRAKAAGGGVGNLQQAVTRTSILEPCVGLAQTGELSAQQRAMAMRWARELIRKGPMDFPCMGHRAVALIEHYAGHAKSARQALDRALEASTKGGGTFRRYVCLEAARDITGLSSSQEDELAELRDTEGLMGAPYHMAALRGPAAAVRTGAAGGRGAS